VVPAKDFGFAMAARTRPIYAGLFFTRGANTYLIAHEISHQWLFNTWLYTKGKPSASPRGALRAAVAEPKSYKMIDENTRLIAAGRSAR
jgi:hypothetical protein